MIAVKKAYVEKILHRLNPFFVNIRSSFTVQDIQIKYIYPDLTL